MARTAQSVVRGGRRATRKTKASQVQIWKREAKARHKSGVLSFNFLADRPWLVDFDARVLTERLGNIAARTIYESMASGENPATGGRLPAPKKRGGIRLYRTGSLVESIIRSKVTGSAVKARTTVKPAAKFRKIMRSEFSRGHHYFRTDGKVRGAMNDALNGFVAGGLQGLVMDPDVNAVKANSL